LFGGVVTDTYIPELRIGNATLTDVPCLYREYHLQARAFGLPFRDKSFILGLKMMRLFKYIGFDAQSKEMRLSYEESFVPDEPARWARYSCKVVEEQDGAPILVADIPIAGRDMEVRVDTGDGRGLAISDRLWEDMRHRVKVTSLKDSTGWYPEGGTGRFNCRKAVVPELEVGERVVKKAVVRIYPEDAFEKLGNRPLLGTQFFRDTEFVLDFEHSLLWVKQEP